MLKKSLIALLPIALVAVGWYFTQSKKTESPVAVSIATTSSESTAAPSSVESTTDNPLAVQKDNATQIVESIKNDSSANTTSLQNTTPANDQLVDSTTNNTIETPEASSVAIEPLSDAEFLRLEQQLKTDTALRLSLIEEFRYNTDPTRAKQLAALLGPYDDPEVMQAASELAYSGDPQSQIAGLDLLSRIQPRNGEARDIAIDLLSSGNDPALLVATMNVLATPARNVSDTQLQSLNDNLNNLSNHYDPNIRSQTLALMGRWDKNSHAARNALSEGLNDSNPAVRSSATFAINNIRNPDDQMISSLLSIAENTNDKRSTRYAALRALGSMQLSSTQSRRYAIAKRNANRRN